MTTDTETTATPVIETITPEEAYRRIEAMVRAAKVCRAQTTESCPREFVANRYAYFKWAERTHVTEPSYTARINIDGTLKGGLLLHVKSSMGSMSPRRARAFALLYAAVAALAVEIEAAFANVRVNWR